MPIPPSYPGQSVHAQEGSPPLEASLYVWPPEVTTLPMGRDNDQPSQTSCRPPSLSKSKLPLFHYFCPLIRTVTSP